MSNTTKKFTKRDFYESIIAAFTGAEIPVDKEMPNPDEIVEFCNTQITNLETAKAGAARRNAAKKAEPDALRDKVYNVVASATEPMTAADVVLELNDEEASMGKVSNRLTKLVGEGVVFKAQATMKDDAGKTLKRMVYSAIPFED